MMQGLFYVQLTTDKLNYLNDEESIFAKVVIDKIDSI
jgi:hypothetical protein